MATNDLSGGNSKNRRITNNGDRRFVIGPRPVSQRRDMSGRPSGSGCTVLGTPADQGEHIPADRRLSNTAEVPDSLLKSEAFQAAAESNDVKVA